MDLRSKRILVTGGGGFLGGHVIRKLKERGVPEKSIFAPRASELDLRLRENCEKAVRGIDLVIHAAAVAGSVEVHMSKPARSFHDNLMMGVELMEAARKAGAEKFVVIGSATEYPDNAPLPFREEDLWLGPVERLHAPYTVAKKMLLVQAQAYRKQYGFNAVHVLLTAMYGPGEFGDRGPIPALIRRIAEAKSDGLGRVGVWGTGRATRDFLYVGDAAEGIMRVAEDYDEPEPINLASGIEISIRELSELIARLMDFKGELHFDPRKPEGQPRRVLDPSRAERKLGFKTTTGLEEGLKETINWHLSQI